jgi:hypothetical protein
MCTVVSEARKGGQTRPHNDGSLHAVIMQLSSEVLSASVLVKCTVEVF